MKIKPWLLFALFSPAILAIVFLFVIPVLQLFVYSFTDASLNQNINFIGLDNYKRFLQSPTLGTVLLRTLVWMCFGMLLKMVLGFSGALLLNAPIGHRGLMRSLILPPWVMPLTISSIVWTWLFNGQFGMISGLAQKLSLIAQPFEFLGQGSSAFIAVLLVDAWAGIPLITIFLIAALESVPASSLEAAYLEGASRSQRFFFVIFPQTLPVFMSLATITAIFTFNSFDVIWVMTNGGPNDSTTTLPILAYKTAIGRFQIGQGAAQTIVMCIILALLGLVYLGLNGMLSKRVKK